MSEERNCGATLYCSNKPSVDHAVENSICENFGNEAVSSDSTSLKIMGELRHVYEDRLRKIDDASRDGMEIKLKALTSWINDLEEQNVTLVQTVEQLQKEAADRVALLEKSLKKSSHIELEYMSKLEDYDNRMLDISDEKNKPALMQFRASSLVQAQQTEEILKTRVGNLQNDISGLLELIQRARYYGSWDADGIIFMEVTYEDIFGTHPNQISDKYGNIDNMQSTIDVLHQKLRETLEDYHGKEREIMRLQEQVTCQKADIALKEVQLKCLAEKTQEFRVPAELKHIMHMVSKSIVCNVTVMSETNTGESTSEKLSSTQDDQSEEEITPVVPKSIVCDVAVMTDTDPAESKLEKVLLKQGNHQSEDEMPESVRVPPINKKGVCFASPSTEDYEKQIVELQKALKEAQNGTESATKHIAENNKKINRFESTYHKADQYEDRETLEKVKLIKAEKKMLSMGIPTPVLFGDFYEQGDTLRDSNNRRGRVNDLEKKLFLHKKMNESQLKVIGDLQDDLRKLRQQNEVMQDEIRETRFRRHEDWGMVCEGRPDKIKEYRIKIHGLECKLFLAEILICEKNEMIQMLLYKLHAGKEIMKNEHNRTIDARCCLCSMLWKDSSVTAVWSDSIRDLIESLQVQVQTLKSTISAKERVILDQQEMIKITQDALNMSQDEVKELQNQLKNFAEEHLVNISNLQQALISTNYEMEEWQNRSAFENTFGNEEKENDSLQTCYQDLLFKFNGMKKYWSFLLKQVLEIEHEMQKDDLQQNELVEMIMNLIMSIKDYSLKYKMTEEEKVVGETSSCLEINWHEARERSQCNEPNHMKQLEKKVQTEITCALIEDLKREITNLGNENSVLENQCDPDEFKIMHLNELKKLLDMQVLQQKYLLEKICQNQIQNSKYLDILHLLDEEVNMLQAELNERDYQLQNTALTMRALSSESSVLHKTLQKQEMNVEKLEEQLMQSNMRLQQALSYLDEKNTLLQKLNKENREMQGRMRKLEIKVHSAVTPEQYNVLQNEISSFNLSIQQLMKVQEKNNLEMREHWWWDDGWHDE